MDEKFNGKVENRDGKLVLSVSSKTARSNFSRLVKLLNTKKADMVEVTNHGTVACVITAPLSERLSVGDFKIK